MGGGQAGLAMGFYLRARRDCGSPSSSRALPIAPGWRERWDSLTLFSRHFGPLPGLPFPGDRMAIRRATR